VILFVIKLYARINIFKYIKKKHGQDIFKKVKLLEDLKTKVGKIQQDIEYVKTCKKEHLIPTFAKINVAIRNAPYKLKRKIACLIMETEIQNKHNEKRKLRSNIKNLCRSLSVMLSSIEYHTVMHQITIATKSRHRAVARRHSNKLIQLRMKYHTKIY